MRIRVVYHSQTGNTRKIAAAIAKVAGCAAEEAQGHSGPTEADLLFLGAAVYASYGHKLHPSVDDFIGRLDSRRVRRVALFKTGFDSQAIELMRSRLARRGIEVANEHFSCKGKFLFFNLGHPDSGDTREAAAFAKRVIGEKPS